MVKVTLSGMEICFSKDSETGSITYTSRKEALDSYFLIAEALSEYGLLNSESCIIN